jgi:hypothetical protein
LKRNWLKAIGHGLWGKGRKNGKAILNFEVLKRLESFIQNPKFIIQNSTPIAYSPQPQASGPSPICLQTL